MGYFANENFWNKPISKHFIIIYAFYPFKSREKYRKKRRMNLIFNTEYTEYQFIEIHMGHWRLRQ